MKNVVTIIFKIPSIKIIKELEIPINMTANEFCRAMLSTYLNITNEKELYNCYLKSENPIALIKGEKTLQEFGLYDGSIIICDK